MGTSCMGSQVVWVSRTFITCRTVVRPLEEVGRLAAGVAEGALEVAVLVGANRRHPACVATGAGSMPARRQVKYIARAKALLYYPRIRCNPNHRGRSSIGDTHLIVVDRLTTPIAHHDRHHFYSRGAQGCYGPVTWST